MNHRTLLCLLENEADVKHACHNGAERAAGERGEGKQLEAAGMFTYSCAHGRRHSTTPGLLLRGRGEREDTAKL